METVILNRDKCGYKSLTTIGKMIFAYGLRGGVTRLDISRVLVVAENSKKRYSFLSRFGITQPELIFDVDMDIYLADGSIIEVHSTDPKFLNKMLPYIWELHMNPRADFYKRR